MGPEKVLSLFDSCWFTLEIFKNKSQTPNLETNPDHQIQETTQEPKISSLPTIHVRSKSDQLSSITSLSSDILSPTSVLLTHHLHIIFSGKESKQDEDVIFYSQNSVSSDSDSRFAYFETQTSSCGSNNIEKVKGENLGTEDPDPIEEDPPMKSRSMRRIWAKKGMTKSLSDLEFEELKGFMDLGFVFSEEDVNSSLVEILPGLQRLGKKSDGRGQKRKTSDKPSVTRPYLSEAWDVLDRRKRENPLMNWRIPDLGNEMDMKDSLKWWAHTVASAVR
ncbi:FMN-dependent NADH-azoreductase [Actinidia chinensis var. chinensis]|uniref:FMN-dependent NADH-azoreductase n=1 Tax=Actinidia chinensis var. chinensis TaxID=1590841 RepID=A0A2R6PYM2_ACTCC|nr:FMN-dependent NADH-azoreductase [Actinidia chinensis var. chinensis]